MDWNAILDFLINWLMNTGVKIVIALAALFISFRIINLLTRKITKRIIEAKHHADKTIVKVKVSFNKFDFKPKVQGVKPNG